MAAWCSIITKTSTPSPKLLNRIEAGRSTVEQMHRGAAAI
jgi:hypothetical protein